MTADAMQLDSPSTLPFARSESRAVGAEGPMMKMLRDNAPRIVGGLKLIGDAFILAASFSAATPIGLLFYGLFAMPGRLIMMIYGTKEHQEKVAREAAERGEIPHDAGAIEKVTHPSRYPIESSAGLSILAETSALTAAGQKYLSDPTWSAAGNGVLEIIAIWMYANILFGKEKKADEREKSSTPETQDSLKFAASESRAVGFAGRLRQIMKDNPVMTSCLVGAGISIALMITGTPLFGTFYMVGAGILLAANLLQAFLVRKNDYNIEGAKDRVAVNESAQQRPASFQDRIATERQDMALAPRLAT